MYISMTHLITLVLPRGIKIIIIIIIIIQKKKKRKRSLWLFDTNILIAKVVLPILSLFISKESSGKLNYHWALKQVLVLNIDLDFKKKNSYTRKRQKKIVASSNQLIERTQWAIDHGWRLELPFSNIFPYKNSSIPNDTVFFSTPYSLMFL